MSRRPTRSVKAGSLGIGSDFPVTIQTMTNVPLADVRGTLEQIERCAALGCDIIRAAVDDERAEKALPEVIKNSTIPLVADIQFHSDSALAAIEAGIAGVRLNPGLLRDEEKLARIAAAAVAHDTCIRVGANGGSVDPAALKANLAKFPSFEEAMADLLCSSALAQCEALEKYGVRNIKVALKSSSIPVTLASYRRFAAETDYPLHLGLTESGTPLRGSIKSAVVLSTLLSEGIGDTIRVSLTDDPVHEIEAGQNILRALGLYNGGFYNIVSCPTCGRTSIDLISICKSIEERLATFPKPSQKINVAVMGCVVNGPGEAKEADVGIAGGNGEAILFKKGQIIRKIKEENIVNELINEIVNLDIE